MSDEKYDELSINPPYELTEESHQLKYPHLDKILGTMLIAIGWAMSDEESQGSTALPILTITAGALALLRQPLNAIYYRLRNDGEKAIRYVQGYPGAGLMFTQKTEDQTTFLKKLVNAYGKGDGVFRINLGLNPVVISNPELTRELFKFNDQLLTRAPMLQAAMHKGFGDHISAVPHLTDEERKLPQNEIVNTRYKEAHAEFITQSGTKKYPEYLKAQTTATEEFFSSITEKLSDIDGVINIENFLDEMHMLTIKTVFKALYDKKLTQEQIKQLKQAVPEFAAEILPEVIRTQTPIINIMYSLLPVKNPFDQVIVRLAGIMQSIVPNEDPKKATAAIITGVDTVAASFASAYCLLAANPEIQECLYKEFAGQEITKMHLKSNDYLRQVTKAVYEWFPVLPIHFKEARGDIEINGYKFKKGDQFYILSFLLKQYGQNFSTGKRACPGRPLAELQLKLFIVMMVMCFKVGSAIDNIAPEKFNPSIHNSVFVDPNVTAKFQKRPIKAGDKQATFFKSNEVQTMDAQDSNVSHLAYAYSS